MAERARKWARRHPRITSGTSIALMCGAVVLGLAALLFLRGQRLARLEAYATLAQFREGLETVEYLLNLQTSDRKRRQEGTELAHRTLGLYAAEADPAWRERPLVAHLDEPDRAHLMEDVGELALVLARADALEAADRPEGNDRAAAAEAGLRACDLAARCFDVDKPPRSLWAHRAELTALLGREDEARDLRAAAEATPLRTPGDLHRAASDLVVAGEYRKALPLALQATRDDPRSLRSWFVLAYCHDRLDQLAEAVACYGTCIALRPEFPYPWLNRGIVQVRREEPAQAVADFERTARLKPNWYEPYLNRAVANTARGEPAAAIRDVELALERGRPRRGRTSSAPRRGRSSATRRGPWPTSRRASAASRRTPPPGSPAASPGWPRTPPPPSTTSAPR